HGSVEMECVLRIRFGYGNIVPWVRRQDGRVTAIAGPDSLWLDTPVGLSGRNMAHHATFTVAAGQRTPFALTWSPSHAGPPAKADCAAELELASRFRSEERRVGEEGSARAGAGSDEHHSTEPA